MAGKGLPWSDEEMALLRELGGMVSTAQVADAISALGVPRTRHAVIGMAHRHGIDLGGVKQANRPKAPPRPGPGTTRRAIPKTAAKRAEAPYSVQTLPPDGCRWIDGQPEDERPFTCGEPRLGAKPYCVEHVRRADGAQAPRRAKHG